MKQTGDIVRHRFDEKLSDAMEGSFFSQVRWRKTPTQA